MIRGYLGLARRRALQVATALAAGMLLAGTGAVQAQADANPLVERLFRAYFLEGQNVGDRSVLVDIAGICGLDARVVQEMLSGDDLVSDVEAEIRMAQEMGVQGVPFFIRAGKNLPLTCTEVLVRLKRAPSIYAKDGAPPNHVRMRISPDVTLALGATAVSPTDESQSAPMEMQASHHPGAGEMDAYERVLGDALHGEQTLFAREDYVEEAWRIVDPVLAAPPPVHAYAPGTWGPAEAAGVAPPLGWHDPRA